MLLRLKTSSHSFLQKTLNLFYAIYGILVLTIKTLAGIRMISNLSRCFDKLEH